ncbi:hypothetical protein [Tissierella sp.]
MLKDIILNAQAGNDDSILIMVSLILCSKSTPINLVMMMHTTTY